jgi:hypothetical protein
MMSAWEVMMEGKAFRDKAHKKRTIFDTKKYKDSNWLWEGLWIGLAMYSQLGGFSL